MTEQVPIVNLKPKKPSTKTSSSNRQSKNDEQITVLTSPVKQEPTFRQIQSQPVSPIYQVPPNEQENDHTESEDDVLQAGDINGLEYSFADYKSQKVDVHGMEDLISQDDDDISLTSFYDDEDKTFIA
jgi:hypothetical protein